MSRWTDTKGASLRFLESFDQAPIEDLREAAAVLEAHAPGSVAAVATRRALALVEAALVSLTEPVCETLGAIGHALENGHPAARAVFLATERYGTDAPAEPQDAEVAMLVREAENALKRIHAVRDALLVRGAS